MKRFERITIDPAQMSGVPCIRGLRIPVATVLRLLAGGLPEDRIIAEYAAAAAMERELPLPHSA
jgi:uncharacterized protein (DUF433 family)